MRRTQRLHSQLICKATYTLLCNERQLSISRRTSSKSLYCRKITDKIGGGRTPEPLLKKSPQADGKTRKTIFVDEEDEKEFDSELAKTLAAIKEDYISEGFTLPKEDDSKSEGGGEDEVLARYAATMGDKQEDGFKSGTIPGLEGLHKGQSLFPDNDTDEQVQMLFDIMDRERMEMEEDAKEVETWPEWHAYEMESDIEEDKIRKAWDESPEPVTKESAARLAKAITEMDIAVRTKWENITAERLRKEIEQGLHPKLAREVAEEERAAQDLRARPVRQIVELPPANPAEKAVRAVRALLPET